MRICDSRIGLGKWLATTVLAVACGTAQASSISFTAGPRVVGSFEIYASATFDFNPTAKTVTVSLLNLESNPTSVTQGISYIRFNLVNASTTPTLVSSGVSTFKIDSNGIPQTQTQANDWTVSNSSGSTLVLCTLCPSSGSPDELVMGGPAANGNYTNGNGGIKGNNAHNPFIIGSGATYASGALHNLDTTPSWTFSVPTMTQYVSVTSVVFGFGTAYGLVEGNYDWDDAPEPGSVFSMIGGIGILGIGVWKRRQRAPASARERMGEADDNGSPLDLPPTA